MDKVLILEDSINIGKGKKKIQVSELVNIKGEIFNYIKKGYLFDDEVLKLAHITKHVGPATVKLEIVERKTPKVKEYAKDTESLKNILKSLNTIDNQATDEDAFTKNDNDNEDMLDLISEEDENNE